MALVSFGKITVTSAGTLVRVTVNETDPAAAILAHSCLFEQIPGNTGKIYVFERSTGSASTYVGCVAVLAIPTVNVLPSYSVSVLPVPAGISMNDFYIDAQVNGEGCLVSYLQI